MLSNNIVLVSFLVPDQGGFLVSIANIQFSAKQGHPSEESLKIILEYLPKLDVKIARYMAQTRDGIRPYYLYLNKEEAFDLLEVSELVEKESLDNVVK